MQCAHEAKQRAITIEAPGSTMFDDLEPGFVVTIEDLVGTAA
jgi:hypothetical protein